MLIQPERRERVPALATLIAETSRLAVAAAARAAEIDTDGGYPDQEIAAATAAGLLAAPLVPSLGGLGLGSMPGSSDILLRLLALLGWGNLSLARLYEGHVNALLLIQAFGTPAQAERFAQEAREGHVFAVWNSQGEDGMRLLARPDGGFTLCGAKTFASGAGHVTRPLLTAMLPDGGWQMIVAPTEDACVAVDGAWWRPLGMRASASAKIDLTGTAVPAEALIGASGDYYRQPWFSGGAIRFAAAQLGGAAALVDAVRLELRKLGRAEDPFQRARLGEVATSVHTGLASLGVAASYADRSALSGAASDDKSDQTMVFVANVTRVAVERICSGVLDLVERSLGARALLRPHPVERIGRDLTLYLRQPAPDATLTAIGDYAFAATGSTLDFWPPQAEPVGGRDD